MATFRRQWVFHHPPTWPSLTGCSWPTRRRRCAPLTAGPSSVGASRCAENPICAPVGRADTTPTACRCPITGPLKPTFRIKYLRRLLGNPNPQHQHSSTQLMVRSSTMRAPICSNFLAWSDYSIPTRVEKGGVGEAPTENPTHFPNDLGMLYHIDTT